MGLSKNEKAILMTAGSEKLESSYRYSFTLEDGQSKLVPLYFSKTDTDGENSADEYFDLTTNYPSQEILWKSRCSGGYYSMTAYNQDVNGAKLGITMIRLNKYNVDLFPDSKIGAKSAVLSEILQDTLKKDDATRQFVPHMKEVVLQTKQTHHEEGNMPTGHETNPITTPGAKYMLISNLTPITSSSVVIQMRGDFYQYSPGVSTSTRSARHKQTVDGTEQADPD